MHRQIEDLLGYPENAREVSSEMLGGIQAGLATLDGYDDAALADAERTEHDLAPDKVPKVLAWYRSLRRAGPRSRQSP